MALKLALTGWRDQRPAEIAIRLADQDGQKVLLLVASSFNRRTTEVGISLDDLHSALQFLSAQTTIEEFIVAAVPSPVPPQDEKLPLGDPPPDDTVVEVPAEEEAAPEPGSAEAILEERRKEKRKLPGLSR